MRKCDVCLFGSGSLHSMTQPAQSVNRFSGAGARIKKKTKNKQKTIRQHWSMIPASFEAEEGFLFSSLLLYHFKYMQNNKIRSGSRNKQGNKQNRINLSRGKSG